MSNKVKYWFLRIWIYDRAGALTSIASAFSNRGISLESIVGYGADKATVSDGSVFVTFKCTEDAKEVIKRIILRLSKVKKLEERPHPDEKLRKALVARMTRVLTPNKKPVAKKVKKPSSK